MERVSFDYKPFGDTLNAGGESRIGYAAQERDEESRYFAMGARQYDPLSGRFLSVDPLYESFPDKTPYHYCNNNPMSFKDPSGLSPEEEKGKEDEVQFYDELKGMEDSKLTENIFKEFDEQQEIWERNFRDQIYAWSHMNDAQSEKMRAFAEGGGGSSGGIRVIGSDEEIEKIVTSLQNITGSKIELDKNGYIISVIGNDKENESENQRLCRNWLIETIYGWQNNNMTFDIKFVDDNLLENTNGTRCIWDWNSKENEKYNLENPTLVISKNTFLYGKDNLFYDYKEEHCFIFCWDGITENEATTSLPALLGHEILGHAFQYFCDSEYYRTITIENREVFAITRENIIHEMYGEPYRIRINEEYNNIIFPKPYQRMNIPWNK
jgi:RHS repeat-associated protein